MGGQRVDKRKKGREGGGRGMEGQEGGRRK